MITVFLRGGLGNQMFQYALGLSLARKKNTSLVLDTTLLNDRFPKGFIHRNYDLDVFTMQPQLTAFSRISRRFPIPGVWLGLDLVSAITKDMIGLQRIVREKSEGAFDPAIFDVSKDSLLWGFWQSEKYFIDVADELRASFQFKYPLEGIAQGVADNIQKTTAVSIHIRRSDYLLPKTTQLYGATDVAYYERAGEYIAEHVKDPHGFIFSDDPAWVRENLKFPFPATYIDWDSAGPKSSFHVHLMSLCRHHIIGNSTFSWWPAWLNPRPEKIVIAPLRWYADPSKKSTDIVPESWIRL